MANFSKAIRRYTNYTKIVFIDSFIAMYENGKGNVFLAMGEEKDIINYDETGRHLHDLTYKVPFSKMTMQDRIYIMMRLKKNYSKARANDLLLKIVATINRWDKIK